MRVAGSRYNKYRHVPALPREDKAKKKASSVQALRYWLDDRGSIPGRAAILSWATTSRTTLRPTQTVPGIWS
jgi:hypothetical protein